MPVIRSAAARVAVGAAAAALAAALAGCGTPAPAFPVTILASPGRFGTIETAAAAEDSVDWWDGATPDDEACSDSDVAMELARFLPRALGVGAGEVRMSAANKLPGQGDVIVLGTRRSNALVRALAGKPLADGSADETYRLRARTQQGRTVLVVEGATWRGTRAGAYALLEKIGVRFYDLGDSAAAFPAAASRIPPRLDQAETPSFLTRGFWAWEPRGNPDFFRWMSRNRINLWTAAEPNPAFLAKLGLRLTGGGHMLESDYLNPLGADSGAGDESELAGGASGRPAAARPRTRFEAHPEWYGFERGARQPGIALESGLNFCTSNTAAVKELARGLIESLQGGAMRRVAVVQFWPLDGGRWCSCGPCRAQGNPADRWLTVTAAVTTEIERARRDGRLRRSVTLMPPAYIETAIPPTRPAPASLETADVAVMYFPYFRCYAHALGDPNCREINRLFEDRFRGWTEGASRPYRGAMGVCEYYNVSWTKSLPVVMPHVMAADLSEYARGGVRNFTYMHAPSRAWGSWTLNHALLARLLWNPGLPVDSLIADFTAREYPGAQVPMRDFYAALESATANLGAVQFTVGSIGSGNHPRLLNAAIPVYGLRHLPAVPGAGAVDSAASLDQITQSMARARRALDKARSGARDPRVRIRISEVEERFAYGESMIAFWSALIRATSALRENRPDDFQSEMSIAERAAAQLAQVKDLVQVAALHANARDGLEASGAAGTYTELRAILRAGSRR